MNRMTNSSCYPQQRIPKRNINTRNCSRNGTFKQVNRLQVSFSFVNPFRIHEKKQQRFSLFFYRVSIIECCLRYEDFFNELLTRKRDCTVNIILATNLIRKWY